jgi:hypothetical protein
VRIAVVPTLSAANEGAAAEHLAGLVHEALGCTTVVLSTWIAPLSPSSNQQQRLWGLASALRTTLAAHPVDADYVVAAEVGLAARGPGFVNFVLTTRTGDVAIADFQNDQHADFQNLAPKTVADAERLIAARLVTRMR